MSGRVPERLRRFLDVTGFNKKNLVLATMKAMESDEGKSDEDHVLNYLYRNARENVRALLGLGEEVELTPWQPREPDSHQSEDVKTQLIRYKAKYSLFDRLGNGDSIRDVIDMFRESRRGCRQIEGCHYCIPSG